MVAPMLYVAYKSLFSIKKRIMTTEETLEYIISNHVSISRYGDGELGIMNGQSIGFQGNDNLLAKRLKEIAESPVEKLLVCVPSMLVTLDGLKPESKSFWEGELGMKYFLWAKMFSKHNLLGDAGISRFYIDWKDGILRTQRILPLWRKIWHNRDLIIVEGKSTRLVVGNDIFLSAKSISRILCPEKDAFKKYDLILSAIAESYKEGALVIIALGPTATVLAYDLAKMNVWAIDIGHIDIEYEWYLMRAKNKVKIPFKATNEVGAATDVASIENADYERQIKCWID